MSFMVLQAYAPIVEKVGDEFYGKLYTNISHTKKGYSKDDWQLLTQKLQRNQT